jgi:uncharacterized protein
MNESINFFALFLTGLTTGGLSCMAIQGGMMLSALGEENETDKALTTRDGIVTIASFLLSRLIAYTLLGVVLGWIGSVLTISVVTKGYLQILLGIYLVGVALATAQVHPIFRYLLIKPPKFLMRKVKTLEKNKGIFGGIILGAFTVFMPCAVTQAAMAIAVASGNPIYGGGVMFAFILGTSPILSLFSAISIKLKAAFEKYFYKVSAAIMLLLGLSVINGGVGLTGSVYTFENMIKVMTTPTAEITGPAIKTNNGIQEVTINVTNNGYEPREIKLNAGVKTKVTLITKNTYGCSRAFSVPTLNYQVLLSENDTQTFEFTPTKKGNIVFTCSMGMYRGLFKVL